MVDAVRDVEATLPILRGLQRVVSRALLVVAYSGGAVGEEKVRVGHETNAERIHATFEVAVLPSVQAQGLAATMGVVEVDLHRLLREDLHGPEEAVVAHPLIHVVVLEVHGQKCLGPQCRDVRFQAGWDQDGVCINLDRPIVVQVLAGLLHVLPDVDEDICVAESRLTGIPSSLCRLPRVECVIGVACINARARIFCDLLQLLLVRAGQVSHKAIHRCVRDWLPWLSRWNSILLSAAAEDRAVPTGRHGDLLRHPRCVLFRLRACRPHRVLHGAHKATVATEVRVRARFPRPSAIGGERGPVAKRRAIPTCGAHLRATRPVLVLLKASHSGASTAGAAALRAVAVLAGSGARIRTASHAELVALPFGGMKLARSIPSALLLTRMDPRLASLQALRPCRVFCEALVTVLAARFATLRTPAIRPQRRAQAVVVRRRRREPNAIDNGNPRVVAAGAGGDPQRENTATGGTDSAC
mmetsp:Transcript_43213/g.124927  ORF Transcript_43213/g.124927 Transcript_43213/m.124927 type:complete len:471 (-) Transcript_43213:205-1617(-)